MNLPHCILLTLCAATQLFGQPVEVPVPPEIIDPPWMASRRQAQIDGADSLRVFHGFSLTDRLTESRISFVHRVVDDAGRSYKPAHYDHGNGVSVADVDGDGRPDLYFSNQAGSNQLWRNLGDGSFADITAAAGVEVTGAVGVTSSFADIDNDGDADLYVTNVRSPNVLFENDGSGHFSDVTEGSSLGYDGHSSGAVFFDYDRDGRLDLFLCVVGIYTTDEQRTVVNDATTTSREPGEFQFYSAVKNAFGGHLQPERLRHSRLYRNLGGLRFVDVTEASGLLDDGFSGDAAPVDVNDDGWLDLYVLNMQGHDHYWENDGNGGFVDRSRQVFPNTSWGAMGIQVFDVDNDGHQDIFISDMHSDMSTEVGPEREKLKSEITWEEDFLATAGQSVFGNTLFRNRGDGRFDEMSDALGAENYWPWGVSAGDLNADGWEDLFVTSSMNYPFRYGVNTVLLNDEGHLVDSEFTLGVEPRRGGQTAAPWFELDCSGVDYQHDDCEFQHGRVQILGALGSRSSVLFDLDGDGDLDVVTNDFNSAPMVLRSDLSEQQSEFNYLQVRLVGSVSNRDGLGSRVDVYTADRVSSQVHDGQSGYLSQSRMPLYFGLGAASQIDSIRVTWPLGGVQVIPGPLPGGQLLEVREPTPDGAQGALPPSDFDAGRALHVRPGGDIQAAMEQAAADSLVDRVIVHAGTYRPDRPAQALIYFNARHDGLTLEATGEVILTAANPEVADPRSESYPAIVNHVVYFGDGITRETLLRGFKITGANNFVTLAEDAGDIEPRSTTHPSLAKGRFFYADGGGIKIFGRSYPTIEAVEVFGNYASPCGGGVSVEHRGFTDGSVLFRDSIFRDNRTQVTGSAIDLLRGSFAEIDNCLFVGNIGNTGLDVVGMKSGVEHNPEHGSGALTVFPGSGVLVRHSTFTGNWNGVDDHSGGGLYVDSIFWHNTASGGTSFLGRYEMDLLDGTRVVGCYVGGATADLRGSIDPVDNRLDAPDPRFDADYRPLASQYAGVGYRPVESRVHITASAAGAVDPN